MIRWSEVTVIMLPNLRPKAEIWKVQGKEWAEIRSGLYVSEACWLVALKFRVEMEIQKLVVWGHLYPLLSLSQLFSQTLHGAGQMPLAEAFLRCSQNVSWH